ncbi:mannosyltransferase family protein [Geotalea sp. SG265]|uniref:mannosyltransferase family protein n=1 Tax=Geotalea sp. SG265 TaxID=2922867 RepID=UPI001FAE8ED0|nr:mannosyltransferase family protein [Geotalea sp. SG265]
MVLVLVQYLGARFSLAAPDRVLSWTAEDTGPAGLATHRYLNTPFMNGHVAWDSEYYLSIALAGYHDPAMRAIPPDFSWKTRIMRSQREQPSWISVNHAFFPGYPLLIRIVKLPLTFLGVKETAAATLAGVLISLGGALAGMVALYRIGRDIIDRNAGLRASFYLLVAPASMFLAMVYTEGLFLGLSFSALMFARERCFVPAGILAFAATLTKAAGALLLLPLFLYWYRSEGRKALFGGKKRAYWDFIFVLAPALAYALFNLLMGRPFHFVESVYFSRNLLDLAGTLAAWKGALGLMITSPQSLAYYMVEMACLATGIISVIWMFRHDKVLALYSGAILFFSLTSGVAQGMHRYVLALPSFFLLPAALGRHSWFDRAWVMVNLPFMVMLMTTFVADQWAG